MNEPSVIAARVRHTAAAELELALAGVDGPARVALGLLNEVPAARTLPELQSLKLHAAPVSLDAFAVVMHSGALFVLGNTPRGLMQGVFALRDALKTGKKLTDELRIEGTFQFAQRIFHARFQPWPGQRADVRFIAELGASHCLVDHDWQGSRRSLQGYVTSPIFPRAIDAEEVAANRAGLRRLLDDCADYGLGAMLWLTELPCQGGPWLPEADRAHWLTRFPADVLSDSGTYEGKVLCFSHPRVREFYRDLVARFFAEFSEIETLFVFGQDSGGEFCDPNTCPRCRGLSRIAQRDRLVNFLIDEGRKVRPGLRVLTTGWGWERDADEFPRRQAALPAASGVYLAAQTDGWQCERQTHDFLVAVRKVCRERGQFFIGYDDFHWGDDTVHGVGDIQDFPLGIAAKVKRWRTLGVDGVFDHWGNSPEDIWSNSIACREFFLDPSADPETTCREIARRQFGERAGLLAFEAWQALERAHVALSRACTWPPSQWPMWYAGRAATPVPSTTALEELRRQQNPARPAQGITYNPPDFSDALQAVSDAWRSAAPHYEQAVKLLAQAHAAADDSPVFYHFWWNGSQPSPTRHDHLLRQQIYVESMVTAGRETGLQFGLYALWEKLGRDEKSYRMKAGSLLREDQEACQKAARYFGALGKPKDWGEHYEAKAKRIEKYLSGG